jgi:hypothetical protein
MKMYDLMVKMYAIIFLYEWIFALSFVAAIVYGGELYGCYK